MKYIFLFLFLSSFIPEKSIETYSYTFFIKQRRGTIQYTEKNTSNDYIKIDKKNKKIIITAMKFNERYDTSYKDSHLIFYRFHDRSEFVISEDRDRARYDGIDFDISFYPLKVK